MCYDVPTKIEKGRSVMFVLLDMEWIESRGGHRSLTQLYAARVDEKWNTIVCLTRWSVRASPELRRGSIWRSTATRLPSFVHRIQRKAASSDFSLASAGRRDLLLAR